MRKLLAALFVCGCAWAPLSRAQNPVVRLSYVVPFTSQAATATATSSAIRIPNLSGYGTLTITGSSITGSPTGCQIALEYQQSAGGAASSAFATQAFTPTNAYQSFTITPSAGYAGGDTLVAVYSCSVYPGAGTISATFDPAAPFFLQNSSVAVTGTFWQTTQPVSLASLPALAAGSNTIGAVTQSAGPWTVNHTQLAGAALGAPSNYGTSPGAVAVQGVNAYVTNTVPVSGTFYQATQPVSLASLPALAAGSATIGALTANQSVNTAQIGGTAVVADPCQANAKSFYPINLTANTQVIAGTSGKKTYVCSLNLIAGAATNVALVEGTGSTCGTSTTGMAGGSTAATGWNIAANGGLAIGNGIASVLATATAADNMCILVSAANQISGAIAYVQQ